ncbi:diacylglycerol O-acyltransferase 1 [Nematocida homosporus]|uniref:diacylglycerol O-acyltransferase 1 n=1 Tax=Nematocida homosporus TaxID=1912981 RepID=UPI00221F1D8B|nr:diacylglycerol O-acyltransferase 1 [Nematocida homosporus]KAI5185000.1 diacylglycerol O-acyltransferase 1 [Nematocida homosporus]
MDRRIHSKLVHCKSNGVLSGIHLGVGGIAWLISGLIVANYKIWCSDMYWGVVLVIKDQIEEDLSGLSLLVFLGINVLRWLAVCLVPANLSYRSFLGLVGLGVTLETLLCFYRTTGFIGLVLRYLSVTQLMKGISYLLVRQEELDQSLERTEIEGLKCKTQLWKFILYPTFCYQESYPYAAKISKLHVVIYGLMLMPLSVLSYVALVIRGGIAYAEFYLFPRLFTYVNVVMWVNIGWLAAFLLVFVALFGLQGELTGFADKEFFGSWWDCSTVEYWRAWNFMVHNWVKRHVHRPFLKRNISLRMSKIIVFLVSGIVHEYIFDDCLGCRGLGLFTMLIQIPLGSASSLAQRTLGLNENLFTIIALNLIGAPIMSMLVRWK